MSDRPIERTPAPNDPLDRAILEELRTGIAPETLLAVIDVYEADAAQRVAEISGAVRAGDPRALKDVAHALKGASANLGAARVAQLSARLEELARTGDLRRAPALADEVAHSVQQATTALRAQVSR